MTWMLFALAAYFIFAAVTITDKYLLGTPASRKEAPIPDARVYVFYIGVLGLSAFLLAPFGFEVPSGLFIFLNIFAGFLFILALLLFFFALRLGEVSRVGISVAGLIPLFTLLFIYISNGNIPTPLQLLAFGLLVGGSIVITFEGFENIADSTRKFTIVLFSAVLFGAYFTLVKFLFQAQPFVSVFIWIKIGSAMTVPFFLFSGQVRSIIFQHKKSLPKKISGLFVLKNAAGGVGSIFQHLAISAAHFGEVAIVNALQGVQFALVFFIALFLAKKFPNIIREKTHISVLATKFIGTLMVISGVVLLAIIS